MQSVVQCPGRLIVSTEDVSHRCQTEDMGCVTRHVWHDSGYRVLGGVGGEQDP